MIHNIVRKHSMNNDAKKMGKRCSKINISSTPSLIYDLEGNKIVSSKNTVKEEYKNTII